MLAEDEFQSTQEVNSQSLQPSYPNEKPLSASGRLLSLNPRVSIGRINKKRLYQHEVT
jgi:hypothetical protein